MARFTFHYQAEGSEEPFRISCARLTQAISDRYRAAAPAYPNAHGHEDDLEEPLSDDEDPPVIPAVAAPPGDPAAFGDPAAIHDADLWVAAMRLQWVLKSDRLITARDVAQLLAGVQADGELEAVRGAYRALANSLALVYPALAAEDRPTLLQIVALGSDMALAVAQAPDLLSYVKNELQPVNLAALLRV